MNKYNIISIVTFINNLLIIVSVRIPHATIYTMAYTIAVISLIGLTCSLLSNKGNNDTLGYTALGICLNAFSFLVSGFLFIAAGIENP
ncbi:hypothetical protein [Bacillus sp. 1P06AnD]|uniref:hypothetical protein n=1 Tax=Bacillus sp. 1P06AnD TaxID=3132208 RepID=UPI0039A29791